MSVSSGAHPVGTNAEATVKTNAIKAEEAKIQAGNEHINSAGDEFSSEGGDAPYFPSEMDHVHFMFQLKDRAGNILKYKEVPLELTFHVNPQSFDRSYKKLVSREQTRGGWVEYHGGDDLDTINVNGVSGAFISDKDGSLISIAQGRTNSHERKVIEEFITLFRSNGNYFDSRGFVYEAGNVYLTYDLGVYIGKFETLSITDSFEKPYSLDYTFSFVVERTLFNKSYNLTVYDPKVVKGKK